MANDLPSKRLSRLYGVNHFIVSLTNPLVIPFIRDKTANNDFFDPLVKFSTSVLKGTTQFNYSVAKRFFKYMPSLAPVANTINSVIQQDYMGDINITADFSTVRPRKLLSALSYKELTELITKGEQATWRELEAIRITTKVGRVLDQILAEYEGEETRLARRFL